jgi:hypothetical protein
LLGKSVEAEKRLQGSKLLVRVVLVVNAAPVHHALPVEQLQVRCDEDSVLLQSFGTNLLAVVTIRDLAIDSFLLEEVCQLGEVSVNDESIGLPHGGLQIVISDERGVINLAFPPIGVSIGLTLVLLLGPLILPLLPFVLLVVTTVNDNPLLSISIGFLLVKFVAVIVVRLKDHLGVIQGFDEFAEWCETVCLRFTHQELDDVDHDVGVKGAVVLLGFTQGTSLPVGHLLHFTDAFVKNPRSNFGQPSLLLDEEDLAEVTLRVNEILHVLDKVHVGQLPRELIYV